VLKSTSDRPILTTVAIGTLPNAHGTFEIDHIRFDGRGLDQKVTVAPLAVTVTEPSAFLVHCVIVFPASADTAAFHSAE